MSCTRGSTSYIKTIGNMTNTNDPAVVYQADSWENLKKTFFENELSELLRKMKYLIPKIGKSIIRKVLHNMNFQYGKVDKKVSSLTNKL